MQILVVCRPVPGIDQSEFRRLVSAESAALRELKERGVLKDAWTPGRPGAVLMLTAGDRLPGLRAGLLAPVVPRNRHDGRDSDCVRRHAGGRSQSTPPQRAVSRPTAAAVSAAASRDTYAFVRGNVRSDV